MRLSLSSEQSGLMEAMDDILSAEASFDRWYRPETDPLAEERRMLRLGAEMGWPGLMAPEMAGGSGMDIVDAALVFTRLGAWLAPLGLGFAALAAEAALTARADGLAGDIMGGRCSVGLCLADGQVLGAASPGVAARIDTGGIRLWAVGEGMEAGLALDQLCARGRPVSGEPDVVIGGAQWHWRLRLLLAAQLTGLAQTATSESAGYAKAREQFGRPIGAFQAVRHRIADMQLRAGKAQAQLWMAAVALRDGREDAPLQVLAALLLGREAALSNAEVNIQNHGAIGTTTENIGHLLLKRALLLRFITGSDQSILNELAALPPPAI